MAAASAAACCWAICIACAWYREPQASSAAALMPGVLAGAVEIAPVGASEAVPASSRAAATSLRARCWLPPPNGTAPGRPSPLRAARSSTSRHTTKCAQTAHTTRATTLSTTSTEMSAVSHSRDGSEVGSGLPTTSTSRAGTPSATASVPSTANAPRTRSPRRVAASGPLTGSLLVGWKPVVMVVPLGRTAPS